jgi:hypothetical protein
LTTTSGSDIHSSGISAGVAGVAEIAAGTQVHGSDQDGGHERE